MSNYLISNFSQWRSKIFEQRAKQTSGAGQRVVGIPVDDSSFKIKIIHDLDVIGTDGKLTKDGWNSILTWINNQPSFSQKYAGLKDLKSNFVIYAVDKDNSRKQLITFTVKPRTSAPNLPADRSFIQSEELATLVPQKEATILTQAVTAAKENPAGKQTTPQEATAAPAASSYKLDKTYDFESLKAAQPSTTAYKAIDDTVVALLDNTDKRVVDFANKVVDELSQNKIGENTILFVKGIIAGFGLKDKYKRPLTVLNQTVIDKMVSLIKPEAKAANESSEYFLGLDGKSLILEQEATPAPTQAFDIDAFLSVVSPKPKETANTGDIKLPEGGLVRGSVAKGDVELTKFQNLVIQKFSKLLAGDATFEKFKKFGGDGNYGPTTETVVAMLKAGFGLSDQDGSKITPELVNKIVTEKLGESHIGLDNKLHEDFNVDAAKKKAGSYAPKPKSTGAPKKEEATKKEDTTSSNTTQNSSIQDLQKVKDAMKSYAIEDDTSERIQFLLFDGSGKWNVRVNFTPSGKFWIEMDEVNSDEKMKHAGNWSYANDKFNLKLDDNSYNGTDANLSGMLWQIANKKFPKSLAAGRQ